MSDLGKNKRKERLEKRRLKSQQRKMVEVVYDRERRQEEAERMKLSQERLREEGKKVKERLLKEKYHKAAMIVERKYQEKLEKHERILEKQKRIEEAQKQK